MEIVGRLSTMWRMRRSPACRERWAVLAMQVTWSQISVHLPWRILSISVINSASLASYLSWWEKRTSLVSFQAWLASMESCCEILSCPSTSALSMFQMPATPQAMHLAFMVLWAVAWAAVHCVALRVERCQNFWATSAQSSWHSVTNW